MRRLQATRPHTDCTDRIILGRQNRYAQSVQTTMETFVGISGPVRLVPKSGNDRTFPFYRMGAEQVNLSSRELRHASFRTRFFVPCPSLRMAFSRKMCVKNMCE